MRPGEGGIAIARARAGWELQSARVRLAREELMTRFWWIAGLALVLAAAPDLALAWNCPVQIKAAEDAIKKAELMKLTPEAKGLITQAKRLVEEAKKDHHDAKAKIDHANAMWKAKAALAQAESAAAISPP